MSDTATYLHAYVPGVSVDFIGGALVHVTIKIVIVFITVYLFSSIDVFFVNGFKH
jgi:hypothetical protein